MLCPCLSRGVPGDAQFTDYLVETISLILLPVAVLMCAYALTVFIWRARAIAKKQVGAAACMSLSCSPNSVHEPRLTIAACLGLRVAWLLGRGTRPSAHA